MITIIPARGGSEGLPNKNVLPICGIPLIAHSIIQAKNSCYASDVYVSSDSDKILDLAEHYGATAIKRPDEISDSFAVVEDALIHALDAIGGDVESFVFLQPTSPIRTSHDIDLAVDIFQDGNYDSLFSCVSSKDTFFWNSSTKQSMNYDYKNRARRQDIDDLYVIENGSIYICKTELLRNDKNRLGGKIGTYTMDSEKLFEIDNHLDYNICKFIMETYYVEESLVER